MKNKRLLTMLATLSHIYCAEKSDLDEESYEYLHEEKEDENISHHLINNPVAHHHKKTQVTQPTIPNMALYQEMGKFLDLQIKSGGDTSGKSIFKIIFQFGQPNSFYFTLNILELFFPKTKTPNSILTSVRDEAKKQNLPTDNPNVIKKLLYEKIKMNKEKLEGKDLTDGAVQKEITDEMAYYMGIYHMERENDKSLTYWLGEVIGSRFCNEKKSFEMEAGTLSSTNPISGISGSELLEGIFKKEIKANQPFSNTAFNMHLGNCNIGIKAFKSQPDFSNESFFSNWFFNNNAIMPYISLKISEQNKIGLQAFIMSHIKKDEISMKHIILPIFVDIKEFGHFSLAWTEEEDKPYGLFYFNVSVSKNKTTKNEFSIGGTIGYNLGKEEDINDEYKKYKDIIDKYQNINVDNLPKDPSEEDFAFHTDILKANIPSALKKLCNYYIQLHGEYVWYIFGTKYKIKITLPIFYYAEDGLLDNWTFNILEKSNSRYLQNMLNITFLHEISLVEVMNNLMMNKNKNNNMSMYL